MTPKWIRLDVVPGTSDEIDARGAGAVEKDGSWFADPATPRDRYIEWLPPRLDWVSDDTDVRLTILGMVRMCWDKICRTEQTVVAGFGGGKALLTPAYCGPNLELMAAVLSHLAETETALLPLPAPLAPTRRHYSSGAGGRIYYSSGCRECDRIFGEVPLGKQYAVASARRTTELIPIAREILIPARYLGPGGTSALRSVGQQWSDRDRSTLPARPRTRPTGGPTGRALPSQPAANLARTATSGHYRLWGAGTKQLGTEVVTVTEFDELMRARYQGRSLLPPSARGRDAVEPQAFIQYFSPDSVAAQVLLAVDDNPAERAVVSAVTAAAREGFAAIETYAPLVRPFASNDPASPNRVPAKLVAARFVQYERADEPAAVGLIMRTNVEVHLIIPSVGWPDSPGHSNQSARRIDGQGLKLVGRLADAVFMGELARQFRSAGIEIEQHTRRDGHFTWHPAGTTWPYRRVVAQLIDRSHAAAEEYENPTVRKVATDLRRSTERATAIVGELAAAPSKRAFRAILASKGVDTGRVSGLRRLPSENERIEVLKDRIASRRPFRRTLLANAELAAECAVGLCLPLELIFDQARELTFD